MVADLQPGKSDDTASRRRRAASGYRVRPMDFWMLIAGGAADARLAKLHAARGRRGAFEDLYEERDDPWQAFDPRFNYQSRKYDTVMALLPADRQFRRALDLGCGLGALSRRLAARSASVLGVDVAQAAVDRARLRHEATTNLSFRRADIVDLPQGLDGDYDLIAIMDTLYYLPNTGEQALDGVVDRIADQLAPGGLCVISNHLFPGGWDKATRLSRRIDQAFCRSPRFSLVSRHWHPFFQTTLLGLAGRQGKKAAA